MYGNLKLKCFFYVDSPSGLSLFQPSKIYISHFKLQELIFLDNIVDGVVLLNLEIQISSFFVPTQLSYTNLHTRNETT